MGAWVLINARWYYPQLGIAESYDDNIFADPSDEVDTFITVVIPDL